MTWDTDARLTRRNGAFEPLSSRRTLTISMFEKLNQQSLPNAVAEADNVIAALAWRVISTQSPT